MRLNPFLVCSWLFFLSLPAAGRQAFLFVTAQFPIQDESTREFDVGAAQRFLFFMGQLQTFQRRDCAWIQLRGVPATALADREYPGHVDSVG